MCSYTSITAAATSLGTPEAAAHQVTLQLFWFLSCMSFAPSLSALSAACIIDKHWYHGSKSGTFHQQAHVHGDLMLCTACSELEIYTAMLCIGAIKGLILMQQLSHVACWQTQNGFQV